MQGDIRLLGPAQVRGRDGELVDSRAWRTAKTFDLLRVLALSAERPVSMDTLLELFWPTAEPARGRTSLRTAACQIRKVLGHDSVVRVGNGLALRGIWVDTHAFRTLADRVEEAREGGRPTKIVELVREAEGLYAGDIEVAGSECAELHREMTELRGLRVHLLLEAAEAAAECADWRRSLELARRAAEIETSDRSTRALMRAWFALGETGRPVAEFERLRRHLAEEYGVDPAPQTRALYLEVVSSCEEWPPKETTIGREEQIRQVMTAVTAWLMDPELPSGVVWLLGEPGSGRHAVAREAARSMMLPLCEAAADDGCESNVELLQDHGVLTAKLAETLHTRARTCGRVLIVPVSEVPDGILDASEAVVRIPPLGRTQFRSLMALALQGRPTPRLEEELYEESRGLPGLACKRVRRRLRNGALSWTPKGVDISPMGALRAGIRATLAVLPLACLDLLGGAVVVAETEPRENLAATRHHVQLGPGPPPTDPVKVVVTAGARHLDVFDSAAPWWVVPTDDVLSPARPAQLLAS